MPLRHPTLLWTAASLSGLSLLWLQAWQPQLVPEPLRIAGYLVLQNGRNFQLLTWIVFVIHAMEACISAAVTQQRNFNLQAVAWYSIITFIYGFPGMSVALSQQKQADKM